MSQRIVSCFAWHSTALEMSRDHILLGQTEVATDGATGIGFETAKALAFSAADVVIALRQSCVGPECW